MTNINPLIVVDDRNHITHGQVMKEIDLPVGTGNGQSLRKKRRIFPAVGIKLSTIKKDVKSILIQFLQPPVPVYGKAVVHLIKNIDTHKAAVPARANIKIKHSSMANFLAQTQELFFSLYI